VCFHVYCLYWLRILWCTSVNIPSLCCTGLAGNGHYIPTPLVHYNDGFLCIHSVPKGEVNILAGHSIGQSKQKKCVRTSVLFRTVSETKLFHCTVHCTLYRRATRHVLTRVAKCIDFDGGIFENVLKVKSKVK
jgi:hypothetical protein